MSKREDLTGQRFGRLTVLEYAGHAKENRTSWLCECDCGNRITVSSWRLKSGNTKSCGCYRREHTSGAMTTHGLTNHPLHQTWRTMHKRCTNEHCKSYDNYGGRGITICDEWYDFKNFYDWSMNSGYEQGSTIDRINNDGNYEPDNCRWVDRFVQSNNRRYNRRITYNEITHNISEWARLFNVPYMTLYYRIGRDDMSDFERYFQESQNY